MNMFTYLFKYIHISQLLQLHLREDVWSFAGAGSRHVHHETLLMSRRIRDMLIQVYADMIHSCLVIYEL